MWKVIILAVLIHSACSKKTTVADYCKVSSSHTVCKTECGRSSYCGTTKDKFSTVTEEDRQMILDRHNEIRNEVAEGKWVHVKLQKAADMQVLSWDMELEWVAGCWMKQCTFEHDKERSRADGTKCGQNLKFSQLTPGYTPAYKMDKQFWHGGLKAMFEEYKLLPKDISHFYKDGGFQMIHGAGHLTALVWGATKFVGCAKIHYKCSGDSDCYMWGCNYAPGGNVGGGKMYTPGDPACADKNDKYPSLCGTIRPLSEDKYEPPFRLDDAQINKPNLLLILIVLYVISIILF